MAKIRLKHSKKIKLIDLNGRRHMTIVEITQEESLEVDREYKRTFEEMNKRIDKKMVEHDRNLEELLRMKVSSENPPQKKNKDEDLFTEYAGWIKKDDSNSQIINEFEDYYDRVCGNKKYLV